MIYHNYYENPTGIDKQVADLIIRQCTSKGLQPGVVMNGKSIPQEDSSQPALVMNGINTNIRSSEVSWVSTDNWIAGMMAHFVHSANINFFNFDLTDWSDNIQYTEYNGAKSHYGWHADLHPSTYGEGMRKLSISLLLSGPEEYEGGELQIIHTDRKEMVSLRPPLGTAIIFPSTSLHRVRPLKSGRRISLVGWMGGPNFK